MSGKKPLEPLIPLDEFGKIVAEIARVPKSAVEREAKGKPTKTPTKRRNK